jgi:hypothetical protein
MGDMEDFRETLNMASQAADAMIGKIKKQENL